MPLLLYICINSIEAAPAQLPQPSTGEATARSMRSDGGRPAPLERVRLGRAHHITEEIITGGGGGGHLLYVRHWRRVARTPPAPAVRRINQPKNYKHSTAPTRSSRRAPIFSPIARRIIQPQRPTFYVTARAGAGVDDPSREKKMEVTEVGGHSLDVCRLGSASVAAGGSVVEAPTGKPSPVD